MLVLLIIYKFIGVINIASLSVPERSEVGLEVSRWIKPSKELHRKQAYAYLYHERKRFVLLLERDGRIERGREIETSSPASGHHYLNQGPCAL